MKTYQYCYRTENGVLITDTRDAESMPALLSMRRPDIQRSLVYCIEVHTTGVNSERVYPIVPLNLCVPESQLEVMLKRCFAERWEPSEKSVEDAIYELMHDGVTMVREKDVENAQPQRLCLCHLLDAVAQCCIDNLPFLLANAGDELYRIDMSRYHLDEEAYYVMEEALANNRMGN